MTEDPVASQPSIVFPRTPAVLVGREREQVFLREELAATLAGHGRLVLLGGEAGIGKTTLAKDLVREAQARGARVLTGHCYDLTNTPPYGPWLELVAGYPANAERPSPPAAFAGGSLARITDRAALFADVRRFFAEASGRRPLVVLLEDLHWADPASLELLRHVAPHVRGAPLLLIATYRVDELTRRHPFALHLPSLVREAEGFRLDLRRLDAPALRALVAAHYHLPAADDDRLVDYLNQHAEGNPFFATELLRALEEEALLAEREDQWRLGEIDHVVVPTFLRQVIDGRVARLGETVREPLAIAAVIGQDVPLSLWGEVAGLDDEELLDIVEQAVEGHLLTAERDGARARFVHALTREALYEGVLPPRRRRWHQQVADTLMAAARPRDNPDPDAIAYHLQQAGDPRAWEWLVQAGDRAQRAYAWLTAAERLRDAATLLDGVAGEEHRRCRLLHRLSRLKRFSLPEEALAYSDEAAPLAAQLGDPVLAADVLYQRGVLLCYANQFQSGLAAMEDAATALAAMPLAATRSFITAGAWLADVPPETAPSDSPGAAEAADRLHAAGLHIRRATYPWFCASAGQLHTAVSSAEQFIAVLATTSQTRGDIRFSTAYAYHGLGIAHAALGRPDAARQAWQQARDIFTDYDHHALTAFTLLDELRDVALTFGAADPAARRQIAAAAEAAIGRAGGAFRPGLSSRLAWLGCLVLDGRWDEADRILQALPAPGNAYLQREVTAARAHLARHRGEPDVAWEQIVALFPDGAATAPGDLIHQEGLALQRLAAELCLDAGDRSGAQRWLAAHDRWLAWSGAVLGQAEGHLVWTRFHVASTDDVAARASAAAALAGATAPEQPLVRLAAHRLLSEIETSVGVVAAAETHAMTALALAEACEAPFERALTLLALAALRVAMNDTAEARSALETVRQLCTPLGATAALARADELLAHLPANAPGEPYPAGLTQREVDVLRLLAQRQTDKEIADALFLGPRTVQSHVAHILNKMGVSNRREAGAAAERLGLL